MTFCISDFIYFLHLFYTIGHLYVRYITDLKILFLKFKFRTNKNKWRRARYSETNYMPFD